MRKSEQICARVTPEVMANLRALADKESMVLSEFIRRALAEKASQLASPNAHGETASRVRPVGDPAFGFSYR
jgi:hypothetical protein